MAGGGEDVAGLKQARGGDVSIEVVGKHGEHAGQYSEGAGWRLLR